MENKDSHHQYLINIEEISNVIRQILYKICQVSVYCDSGSLEVVQSFQLLYFTIF